MYAEKYKVGVVLEDFSPVSIQKKISEIERQLYKDRITNMQELRKIAIGYRGIEIAVSAFEQIFNQVYS